MEAIHDTRFDIFTSSFSNVEIADDFSRAILLIPLMHVGPNKKGLMWTAKMLKKIESLFRSVPYRYDLDGQEGSSHTINKLSSPHFDVGWTYSSPEGSWFDDLTKILWTKGEVTHPDVISKLSRQTSDGKREVNYASMGVIVEKAICSICGSEMSGNTCEEGHNRLEKYEGKVCYKVPTEVSKALHVALTNDPADGEAEIKDVIFQELGAEEVRSQAGEQMDKSQLDNQMGSGMAPSAQQTNQPGTSPSPEVILRELAERVKTIEQHVYSQNVQPAPELVNSAPQDQFVQDNMGTTTQFDKENEEESKMDPKDGQTSNAATSVNPEKKEVQDGMQADPMSQIMGMLQQILQRLPGAETQDMGKESLSAGKGQAAKAQDDIPTDHLGEGAVGNSEDAGNAKNKANMQKPGMVATADNSELVALKAELADLKGVIGKFTQDLELQDSTNVPEFGGQANNSNVKTEVADMGAQGRREKFGEFGSWEAIFNGAESASRFNRG